MSPSDQGGSTPFVSVFRTPTSGKLTLTILSPCLETWPTHWDGERNQFCLRAIHRPCRFCSAGQKQRWEWYAIARAWPSMEVGIGVITGGAFAHCSELQDLKDQTSGLVVYLERIGSAKSAVKARVDERRVSADKLPGLTFTVKDALWRLWKVPELLAQLDQADAEKLADQLDQQADPEPPEPPGVYYTPTPSVQNSETNGVAHPRQKIPDWISRPSNGYHTEN